LSITDKVVFAGRVPHADVPHYYDLVDLFVYPRLPMRLTELVTPLKPLEAMAQGHLVVASDVGGHRELMRDNATAMLFRAGDHQALAKRILDALSSRANWDMIRAAGRRFVEQERNWTLNGELYRGLYGRLVEGLAA
jgi:glycosyltransferase involved in cell wall biosynthesis